MKYMKCLSYLRPLICRGPSELQITPYIFPVAFILPGKSKKSVFSFFQHTKKSTVRRPTLRSAVKVVHKIQAVGINTITLIPCEPIRPVPVRAPRGIDPCIGTIDQKVLHRKDDS